MSQIEYLDVSLIDVKPRLRKVNPQKVTAFAEDLRAHGQESPILVAGPDEDGRYRLVFGATRLAAARQIGSKTIAAMVETREVLGGQLGMLEREVRENIIHNNLTVLDKAVNVAAWREIYEARRGEVKRGRPRKKNSAKLCTISASKDQGVRVDTLVFNGDAEAEAQIFSGSFSECSQRAFGLSRRSVFLALKVASIDAAVRDRIAFLPVADNQSELLLLADQDADLQARIADMLIAEPPVTDKVSEALALILDEPEAAPPPAWQKIASGFAKLTERERDHFFDLYEAEITLWLAKRGGR